jgi:hypothetical protein
MLEWIKDETAQKIRLDYQKGIISKEEAVKKLTSIIAAKMPTLIKQEQKLTMLNLED